MWKFIVATLVLALAPTSSFAQVYPWPGSASQAPVKCVGCVGTNTSGQSNDNLPTYPYRSPIVKHTGRWVDSHNTLAMQHYGFRTARAGRVRIVPSTRISAPPRAYMAIGESVGAYSLSTLFSSTLPGPLESVGAVQSGSVVGGRTPLEKIQMFEGFIYPEATDAADPGGWVWELVDKQTTLGDFDTDDRGYIYSAFITYGWGVNRDDGRTNGTHFPTVTQKTGTMPAERIVAMKSGSRYFVMVSDYYESQVWEVTSPNAPTLVRTTRSLGLANWAKYGDRLAFVGSDKKLHIVDQNVFPLNGSEIMTVEPSSGRDFKDVAVDENGVFWAAETSKQLAENVIVKFTPSGATYAKQSFSVYGRGFQPSFIAAGGGYIAVSGTGTTYAGYGYDVALFRVQNGAPVAVDTDGFFTKYYHTPPSGYARPGNGSYVNLLNGIALYKHEGKTYLFYSPYGLGDVYELEGSDSISITTKTTFGTVNPNSKATDPGPYVGDLVTFNGKPSNTSISYDLDWDFGNPELGLQNGKRTKSNVDVVHQFSGITSASAITAARTVKATNPTDPTITASTLLNLKVPTARVGFPAGNGWTALTANSTGLKAVAGQSFTDASDGSVEGHFGVWTIDGQDTKIKPDGVVPVGGIGAHTVKLTAKYGKYDASFNNSAPFEASTGTISYTVVPFAVKLGTPTKSGSNVVFSAVAPHTTDTATMSATQWTVTWNLTGGVGAAATQSSTVAVGTIPTFAVPAPIPSGSTVTVTVEVDETKLSTAAQSFKAASDSQVLVTPDPVINVTGCANALAPCTLTATSGTSAPMGEWTYAWTVKSGGNTVASGTTNPFSPTISSAGSYTVELKVTKSIFDANATPKNLSVAGAVCDVLPSGDFFTVTSTCASGCDVNETVTFIASAFGYQFQDCDTITWNFGDGGTATGKKVTHAFAAKKSYSIKMTVKNATNTTGVSAAPITITVGGTTTQPPVGNVCLAPVGIDFTWTGSEGCGPGVACKVNEQVTFTGLRGSQGLYTCDNAEWSFGDGNSSTSKTGQNRYATANTYAVSLVVKNELGQASPVTKAITITQGTSSNCPLTPTNANLVVKYEGATSGCKETNSTPCQKGESIAFKVGTFGYSLQSCDTIAWTFGDGGTANSATTSHTYTAAGASFTVTLKVTNVNGQGTVTDVVPFENITQTKPQPVLTYQNFPTTAVKGQEVTFTAKSDISAKDWVWSFGDGSANDSSQSSAATTRTIKHTFASAGQFDVRVTARNNDGAATDTPGSVLSRITITDPPAVPTYRYLLPVVTHIGGLNNSSWRTDVQIYSKDPTVSPSKPLSMKAQLRDMTRTLEIPSSTYIYEDFMRVFTLGNDSGAVVITVETNHPPQIWTRTYNQSENGTFGQFIPAIRLDEAGGGSAFGSGKYYLAGLRHDSRYRTNLGLVNPNNANVNVQVKVYTDEGLSLGTFNRTLSPFQLDQFAIDAATALPNMSKDRPFSVELSLPDGQWLIAYASFIDGGSNDPVYMQAIRESDLKSTDFRTIMVPGVGHTGAWRSDVTLFNPNGRPIAVDLNYYDGSGAKKGEALSVPIKAGEFLQYDDLLRQGVFGNVPDGVGMLRVAVSAAFAEDLYPLAFARTYNDAGTGKTFGQGISGFAVPRANVKPGKPALIPAVRSNTKFYTNIGLTNTTDATVTVTVKLLDPATGVEVKAVPYTLNPFQSIVGQYTLDGRDNASLKVEATGNVWAFASIIDRSTFDPEYVPATPLD